MRKKSVLLCVAFYRPRLNFTDSSQNNVDGNLVARRLCPRKQSEGTVYFYLDCFVMVDAAG